MNIFYRETMAVFALFVIFFSLIVLFYSEETPEDVFGIIYMTPIIVISIMSFSLARVYRKIPAFFYGYLLLGLSFASHVAAEVSWLLMDYLNLENYQSYPDIFYVAFSLFLLLHPWVIMKHFKIKPKRISYVLLITCIIVGNLVYVGLSWDHMDADSFLYGLAFVTMTNTVLGSVVVAIITLKGTKIFKVWILICIALVINTISDIYYYASENFSDWSQGDWVNITWFITYILLIYALIEHRYKYSVKHTKY